LIYIGVTELGYPERDVWKMTPFKILTLFKIHRHSHPERFTQPKPDDIADIDLAMGGF